MSATTNDNKVLMRRVYEEMWNKADASAARRLFAKSEGVERFVSEFLSAFPDLQHTIEAMIAEGDQVAVRFLARGTHQGQWKDFARTGKPVRYTGVTMARIADGRIVEHHTWWDSSEVIEQIR